MRNFLIRQMTYNWDSKVFGKTIKHPRAANVIVPIFLIAGLVNLFTIGFTVVDMILIGIFVFSFFGGAFVDPKWSELDWEQKLQINPDNLTEVQVAETQVLGEKWIAKYKGEESFVEAWRAFLPPLLILLAAILYLVFGSPEAGFDDMRFF